MERPLTKIALLFFLLSSAVWMYSSTVNNYHAGSLLKFGTVEMKTNVDPLVEMQTYRSIAEHSIAGFISYPMVLIFGLSYLMTTKRTLKYDGWLLMSVVLIVMFIPVELLYFWYDWKLIGLLYWGEWPIEEFRKAFLHRFTALAGLHLIAQLCYFTIPKI